MVSSKAATLRMLIFINKLRLRYLYLGHVLVIIDLSMELD